ncbi:glycosyltransferase family 4 protein [Enterococcus sp.]|uniref:glycosyltransferase family 4 protein n=1 Tax=Enterococcus sp. TaxID=35783 RepID=UPI003C72055A
MKRDVLFMCQFFYPEYVSSALLPYQTAKGLAEAGLSVDVLCGYPKEYTDSTQKISRKQTVDNINIYRKKYVQLGRKSFVSRLINYFSFTFSMLLSLFKLRKYKVVIVYSNPPILPIIPVIAKKIFGTKIVFVSYDIYPEIAIQSQIISENSIISKVMAAINKSLFKNVSKVVSLSQEMKDYIVENRKIPQDKIEIIPNWATESFNYIKSINNPVLKEIHSNYSVIVSYFGNMGTAQDVETLMQAMDNQEIKNSKIAFLFAGHGNKKDQLKKFALDRNIKNCFIFDYLKGDDFTEALSISDVFIVSLAPNISGLAVPSKTYSYYQAGKPIIAIMSPETDIAKEIKQYDAGYSINNKSVDDLIKILTDLQATDGQCIKAMSDQVEKLHNDKYQRQYQIKKYVSLINALLEE